MKKGKRALLSILLVLTLVLAACSSKKDEENGKEPAPGTGKPTEAPQVEKDDETPTGTYAEPAVVELGDYLADPSIWEDDGGDYRIKDNTLYFDNAYYGDFCAVRVPGEFQDVTVKFTLQFTDIAKDLSEDAGTWWDSEFLLLLRSNFAGSSYVEGIDGQAGYCITSWGDMSQFALGRSGYDDFLGTYDWPLADKKPHTIEFTAVNNADNTEVALKVVVDGEEIVSVVDDGSQVKNNRTSLYPEAGGITLRAKYLGAEVRGFDPATHGTSNSGEQAAAGKEIIVAEYLGDASKWEDDGGDFTLSEDGMVLNTAEAGKAAAVRLTEEGQNATYKFALQFTEFGDVSMDAGTWWDSEFMCLLRSSLADVGYTDGQTGYTLMSWGDMTTFFLGRSGYDDAFGEFEWPMGDGQSHDFEISLQNNEDNTKVTITVIIDGNEVASVTDDGSLVKQDRTSLFPEAGGLTFRSKYLGVTVK